MTIASITLQGIDQAITSLGYKTSSVKSRFITAVRAHYSSEDSIKQLQQIDTDTLIKSIWHIEDNSDKIRSKRRNLSSIRTSIAKDLKLLSDEKNPDNITISPDNIFDMTVEAKNSLLGTFKDAVKTDGIDLDQFTSLLDVITTFLNKMDQDPENIYKGDIVEQIKEILKKISMGFSAGDGGIEDEDAEIIELDENEELQVVDPEDEDVEVIELGPDEELEEIEELDEDTEEIELDEDEELEDIDELNEEEPAPLEDEDVQDIELDPDQELDEIEELDEDTEEIELDEDEELEDIDELNEEEPDPLEDEEVQEIELDPDEELEEIEALDEDTEEIELDEDEELEDIDELNEEEPDPLEDEDVQEIELDPDEELDEIEELDGDTEEIALDEDEALEDIDELNGEELAALEEFRAQQEKSEQFDNFLGEEEKKYNTYVMVPAGRYTVGTTKSLKHSLDFQEIEMPRIYMARYPVINALFETFIEQTGYITTAEKKGFGTVFYGRFTKGKNKSVWRTGSGSSMVKKACWFQPEGEGSSIHGKKYHPVVQVSLEDALMFASWIGRRLPSEAEWEASARTDMALKYPWGNQWMENACNIEKTGIGDTTSVSEYDRYANAFKLADMLGNVMEWTTDRETAPFDTSSRTLFQVAKGGGWIAGNNITISSRGLFKTGFTSNTIGFRCMSENFQ